MSMPSEVTQDVAAEEKSSRRRDVRWSHEQRGMAFAALVTFLGVAYVGPIFRRVARKPPLADRTAVRLDDARRRARRAGAKVQRRIRRLGGGPIR